jgi:pimeloyl-ACP methyl ester carboxylesterase
MSVESHETSPNRFVEAVGIRYAYRSFGKGSGIPLLFLQHFGDTMDNWDSVLTNSLAADRPVLLFDNAGVGLSTGETPDTVAAMGQHVVTFVQALGLRQVDLLGFSLGGFIAQQVTLDRPDLVRRVVLAGTGPEGGEGYLCSLEAAATATSDVRTLGDFLFLFFEPTPTSQAAGRDFLERRQRRQKDRESLTTPQAMNAQAAAIAAWGMRKSPPYARLNEIQQPALVANGEHDIIVPTVNSFILSQRLPNAYLIVYPDAGHGFLFQYSELFGLHVSLFLQDRSKVY